MRTFLVSIAFITLVISSASSAQWAKPSSETVVLRGGWLFDGVADSRRRNTGIVIRDGKFAEVDSNLEGRSFENARVVSLEDDATILPGMFDLHAHYNLDLVDEGRAEEVRYNAMLFLANGVTATWSAGEFFPERAIIARDRIDRGEAVGTRVFISGPYFGAFRCEYQIKTAADECAAWPNDITESELRREVDAWAARGAVSIKIKQATPEETRILIDQAHKNGMTATGHLANYDDVYDVHTRDAIAMKIDRLEHWITLEEGGEENSELPTMIALFLENGVFFDPNLQMYGEGRLRNHSSLDMVWTDEGRFFTPYARERLKKRIGADPSINTGQPSDFPQRVVDLKAFYAAGGAPLILVGTDEPVYNLLLPGFAYHRELLSLVWAGMSPVDVLRSATINGARALGVADRLGSIEPGKLADLYVANGDPLTNIETARDVRLVIKDGFIHEPADLLVAAEDKIGPSGPDDHGAWKLVIEPLVREKSGANAASAHSSKTK